MKKSKQDNENDNDFLESENSLSCLIADEWDTPGEYIGSGGELEKALLYGDYQGLLSESELILLLSKPIEYYKNNFYPMTIQIHKFLTAIPSLNLRFKNNPLRCIKLAESYADCICKYRALKIIEGILQPYIITSKKGGRPAQSPLYNRFLTQVTAVALKEHELFWNYPVSIANGKPSIKEKTEIDSIREYLFVSALVLLDAGIFPACNNTSCLECVKIQVNNCKKEKRSIYKKLGEDGFKCDYYCKRCNEDIKREIAIDQGEYKDMHRRITQQIKVSQFYIDCKKAHKIGDILNISTKKLRELYKKRDIIGWHRHNSSFFYMDDNLKTKILDWLIHNKIYNNRKSAIRALNERMPDIRKSELRETNYPCPKCGSKLDSYRYGYHICPSCNKAINISG